MSDPCAVQADSTPLGVMRFPRSLDIEITSRCNLRCRYCYYYQNPEVEYRDLPSEEWLRFFDELGESGVMKVTLAGGEPFLREDLSLLIASIVRNRMRFSLLSNGALIDDEIAAFLAATGRCDQVQVSVDGSSAEIHDACRGDGSFERAIRGIRTLQRNGVKVTVRITVHRHNVRDLENIAQLLLDDLALSGVSTNAAGYMGSCRGNEGDVLLNFEERHLAMRTLQRLADRYPGRISAMAGPLADARMWRRMEEARAKGEPAFPGTGGRLSACGCSEP